MSRPVSGVERLWLAAARIGPPFMNQVIVEGEGTLTLEELTRAVQTAAEAQPNTRARLKGVLGWCRWVDSGLPVPVRAAEVPDWDGRSDRGAPILLESPEPGAGHCEVLLLRGPKTWIVVRSKHAVMDGRGTVLFAEAIFAVLRGETPLHAPFGPPTDADLALGRGRHGETAPAPDCAAPGLSGTDEAVLHWARRTVQASPRGMLPRLVLALVRRTDPGARCRIDVPVDLRRHRPELVSNANLTGLIRVSGDSHRGVADPLRSLKGEIGRRVERNEEADFVLAARSLRWVPVAWMERLGRKAAAQAVESGRFGTTATLSNVGRVDLAALSGGGFSARAVFMIPPGSPGLPLFLGLIGGPTGIEMMATVPGAVCSRESLEALLEELGQALQEGP